MREANQILKNLRGETFEPQKSRKSRLYRSRRNGSSPFVTNTVVYLHNALAAKKKILFEGAQGTFLDLDHGTYPYVTSSNTTAGGACTGSGVPPHRVDEVMGVMKAYTTRVGEGPFPSEDSEITDMLHGMGREFGATTGRAPEVRLVRCGSHAVRHDGQRHRFCSP